MKIKLLAFTAALFAISLFPLGKKAEATYYIGRTWNGEYYLGYSRSYNPNFPFFQTTYSPSGGYGYNQQIYNSYNKYYNTYNYNYNYYQSPCRYGGNYGTCY